jgi:hypothetical protein
VQVRGHEVVTPARLKVLALQRNMLGMTQQHDHQTVLI